MYIATSYHLKPEKAQDYKHWLLSDEAADLFSRIEGETGFGYIQTYFTIYGFGFRRGNLSPADESLRPLSTGRLRRVITQLKVIPVMKLRHLYDTDEEQAENPVFFRPYGDVEGTGFAEGTGTVTGDRVTGTLRWTNHPRLREDDVWCPNLTGRITTDDGAEVLYRMRGYSVVREVGEGRDITANCRFATADDAYAWLNTVIGAVEGHIAADARRIHMSVYECVHGLDSP